MSRKGRKRWLEMRARRLSESDGIHFRHALRLVSNGRGLGSPNNTF